MAKKLSAEMMTLLRDKLDIAIIVLEEDGTIFLANQQVARDMHIPKDQLTGRNYRTVFEPEFTDEYEALHAACRDGVRHTMVYYWKARRIWEQISAIRVEIEPGHFVVQLSITNVHEASLAESDYRRMAYFDPVLGLPNSYMLEQDINELEDPQKVGLIYFQVERFADINDLYGIETGDRMLRTLRDWLLETERRGGRLYRVGDGFALLAYGVSMSTVTARSQEILRRFEKPWRLEIGGQTYEFYCAVKLGIVTGKYVKNEMRSLVMRTMRAEAGPEGYVVYNEEVDAQARTLMRRRQQLMNCMKQGMEGFAVYFQPIVEAGTHHWTGVEALCRWTLPQGEQVPPAEFIRLAEQMDLISRLDDWVHETAILHCKRLGLDKPNFCLDVNLSPTQEIEQRFASRILEKLERIGYPPACLNVEITESAKINLTEKSLAELDMLSSRGLVLSLDDFGTGYSSIENLIRLPVKIVKTEKLFIDDIEEDDYKQHLMRSLIEIAHLLGKRVVVEGVERASQCELLEALGSDYFQGYYFSRPLSASQLAKETHRFA